MTRCHDLRAAVLVVQRAREAAHAANARAAREGGDRASCEADLLSLRFALHRAAQNARAAGCDIDDLVEPGVGLGDFRP